MHSESKYGGYVWFKGKTRATNSGYTKQGNFENHDIDGQTE